MKLRIKGNSLRFRITRSELAKLAAAARLDETVHFSRDEGSSLVYALEHEASSLSATLRYRSPEIVIVLPTRDITALVNTDQVGVYSTIDLGPRGTLDLLVEKDFACLDLSDADNVDTFPNPNPATNC
jgi:hypothetical protein